MEHTTFKEGRKLNYQSEICAVIRNFQKNRGYAINELIDGIISRTQYFRFMNGSSIRTEQLLLLLDRLNVSLSEFEIELGRDSQNDYYLYQKKIREAFIKKNVSNLEEIQKDTYQIYSKNQMRKFEHLYILCQLLISKIRGGGESTPQSSVITSYLLKLDKWQLYDIELFINCFLVSMMLLFRH